MPRKSYRRSLLVEGLEDRQLMAGDVTTTFSNGKLTITGLLEDNGIMVTGLAGQIQVTGIEHDGSPTTVNGNYRATYKSVRQIVINLGFGDDALVITNGDISQTMPGVAPVASGGAASSIAPTGSTPGIASSITINMGDGDDLVGLGQFFNKTDELIPGTLEFESWIDKEIDPYLSPLAVSQQMTLNLGDGENELRARAVTIGGGLSITAGVDEDKLDLRSRGTSTDADYLPGVSVKLDSSFSTGGGNDEILVNQFLTRNLSISLGAGNDKMEYKNVVVTKNTTILGGDDHDSIKLEQFSTTKLSVNTGTGDDDVYLKNVTVNSNSTVEAGGGDDIYYDLGGNGPAKFLRFVNFETIVGSQVTSTTISRVPLG